MSNEAKTDALRWELSQRPASAKNWLELVRLLQLQHQDTLGDGNDGAEQSTSAGDAAMAAVAVANAVNEVYERALRVLPYSFKLWMHYVRYRIEHTQPLCRSAHEWHAAVCEVYERALQRLPHMPLLWLSYIEFAMSPVMLRVTRVRHLIAAALRALPVTQHHLVWRRVKRWTRCDSTPHATAQALWRAYLCFDTSSNAQREYLHLLLERNDTDGFMHHCMRLCSSSSSSTHGDAQAVGSASHNNNNSSSTMAPPATSQAQQLLDDVAFWQLVTRALRTPQWTYSGNVAELHTLARCGERHASSPVGFALDYALFLCGQGEVAGARGVLQRLLCSAPDPQTFARVYAIAVHVEDAVTQAFALHPQLRNSSSSNGGNDDNKDEATAALRHDVAEQLFAAGADKGDGCALPLAPLRRLVDEHAMWLNEAQLRGHPRSVALWLKRVELALARVHAGRLSYGDVHALHRQALAQCTAGLRSVPAAVAQLYESAAHALLRQEQQQQQQPADAVRDAVEGNVQAAVAVLLEGAWRTPFISCAVNARLLGLLVEVRLLTATRRPVAHAVLHDTLLPHLITAPARRASSGSSLLLLPGARDALTAVRDDARVWLLAWDMCCNNDDVVGSEDGAAAAATWLRAYTTHGSGAACTVEGLCYVAHAMYKSAAAAATAAACLRARACEYACRVMDCALARSDGDAVARVFVVGQYVALLCAMHSTAVPLLRVRELLQHARAVAPDALARAPHATVDLFVNAALLEYRVGLHSVAVSTMHDISLLAVRTLAPRARSDTAAAAAASASALAVLSLLAGVCEVSIEFVLRCVGIAGVRAYASTLLAAIAAATTTATTTTALLLQRVALHWAALEKRGGDVARAHAVLDACAESQDPHSAHGRVFWQLWQSLCSNVQEYTVVVQRRQHAEVRFRKQRRQTQRRQQQHEVDDARRRIVNAEARRRLAARRVEHDLQSDVWLLRSHLPLLRVQCAATATRLASPPAHDSSPRDGGGDGDAAVFTLPLRLLLPLTAHDAATTTAMCGSSKDNNDGDGGSLLACPFGALHILLRKTLLSAAVVQHSSEQRRPHILHRVADGSEGRLAWRLATPDEVLDASFYCAAGAAAHASGQRSLSWQHGALSLLCSRGCLAAGQAMPPLAAGADDAVELISAQETTNPFALDTSLRHVDALDGSPLPEDVDSGLTTVRAQFRYTSLRWLDAERYAALMSGDVCVAKDADTQARHPQPQPQQQPHAVSSVESLQLVHVSQLSTARQANLMSRVPPYIMCKCMRNAYVYHRRRWYSARALGLNEPLHAGLIPRGDADDGAGWLSSGGGGGTAAQQRQRRRARHAQQQQQQEQVPLLWVDAGNESHSGPVLLRSRHVTRHYYHVSQLPPSLQSAMTTIAATATATATATTTDDYAVAHEAATASDSVAA